MAKTNKSNPNVRIHTPAPIKKRNPVSAMGGLLGALAMSVIAGILLTAAVTPVVALTGTTASSIVSIFENLPSHIDPGKQALPSTIYATTSEGKKSAIASFYSQNRVEVGWNEIAQSVKDAAVAVEDPNFYNHGGINIASLIRATLQNALTGDGPGASTITMQYVRNILVQEAEALLDEDERDEAWQKAMGRDADRKIKEMRLAISVEKQFSKNEILLGYLNITLFGRQVYGIESAAQYYFNKSAKDLSIAESASLIAIVNSPTVYQIDIEENIPANKSRRDYILEKMYEQKKITEEEFIEAVESPVEPEITHRKSGCTEVSYIGLGHFCNYVRLTVENDPSFGNTPQERMHNLSRGGFKIDTTIDLDLQSAAYSAMTENIAPQYDGFDAGASGVTVETGTGRVLAMVQNRQFSDNPVILDNNKNLTSINYNTDFEYGGSKGFQVGSTIKPFNLATWLKNGKSLNDMINTTGRMFEGSQIPARCLGGVYGGPSFRVDNHNNWNGGSRTVIWAMSQSSNVAFAETMQRTDLCDIIETAEDMGVHRAYEQEIENLTNTGTRELTIVPSNAFAGIDEIAPITMATAFAGFAAKGKVCTPSPIDKIVDSDGEEVAFTKSNCWQALDPDVAAGVAYALEYNVNSGIGGHARSNYGVPHFAKTGTTDNFWDHWTVGGSTKAVTAVWSGNVVGKVDTRPSGLPWAGDNVMNRMVNAVDAKFGGEAFDKPADSMLRRVMKTVPDVTGKTPEEAKSMLTALGFTVRDGGEHDSAETKGTVAKTEPAGGSQTGEGGDVTIFISNGTKLRIPDGLIGSGTQSAMNSLNSTGFTKVAAFCEVGSGEPKANSEVISVSPASGTESKRDSQIRLGVQCDEPPAENPDED